MTTGLLDLIDSLKAHGLRGEELVTALATMTMPELLVLRESLDRLEKASLAVGRHAGEAAYRTPRRRRRRRRWFGR